MKVIGKTGDRDSYICVVNHVELEKFLNLYYGKLNRLEVGDSVDLGKGHDFASEAASAMHSTQQFIKDNQKIVTAILNGLQYANLPGPTETKVESNG